MRRNPSTDPQPGTALLAILAAALILAVTPFRPAAAQQGDQRWSPWLGCWRPADSLSRITRDDEAPVLVCVIPATGVSAVEIATVRESGIVSRDTIEVTGGRETLGGNCGGWRSVEWSPDGERAYLHSERTCPGGPTRTSNGLLSITPSGEWLDVRGMAAGGNSGVRVLRYQAVDLGAVAARLPSEITTALGDRAEETAAARMAAGRRLGNADVVEALRVLAPNVVQAWLAETGQRFSVDAEELVKLAAAGVPGSVTDVMVALSYPRVFTINQLSREGEPRPSEPRGEPSAFPGYGFWDPWGYSPFGMDYYSPYGNMYGYGYGLGAYGWYPGSGVIIVVGGTGTQAAPASGGQAVNGHGYRRGGGDGSAGGSSSGGSSTSSTSGSSSSGGSSGSGSSSGRTAKPKGSD